MSATFEIKINAIRTGTVGNLSQVVRKVEFTVKGTEEGQSFELPQSVDLGDPAAEAFIPVNQLSEANVIAWVEASFANLAGVKSHIQMVLDKEVAKHALENTPMPWAPAPEPVNAPGAPSA